MGFDPLKLETAVDELTTKTLPALNNTIQTALGEVNQTISQALKELSETVATVATVANGVLDHLQRMESRLDGLTLTSVNTLKLGPEEEPLK